MAKRFQSKSEKKDARARAGEHLGGKKGNGTEPKQRVLQDLTAGANGPKARDFDHHYKTALGFKGKVDEANGRYRAALKAAKEAGINPAVITAAMAWARRDPLEAQQYFKQLRETFSVAGVEVQLDIFNEGSVGRDAQIFDDGVKAGEVAKSTSDNPHDENTPAGQVWLSGYHVGQAKNSGKIGKTAPTEDSQGAVS